MTNERKITLKNMNAGIITDKGKRYEALNDADIKNLAAQIDKFLAQTGIICEIDIEGLNGQNETLQTKDIDEEE
jgi:hypothetical protein